jgi:cell pole-organizing protein PopZ
VTSEPDMESLLASIRKAIDSDIGKNTRSPSPAARDASFTGAMRESRVRYDDEPPIRRDAAEEISDLRNKIQKNRQSAGLAEPLPRLPSLPNSVPPPPVPRPTPSKSGFAGILGGDGQQVTPWAPRVKHEPEVPGLRPGIQDDLPPAPQDYHHGGYAESEVYPDEVGWAEDVPAFVPAPPPPSLMSPETINAANSSFNQLADTLMARALGERSVEDMTQDLLKGMLRNWLDAHLPSLVEKLVREEIERVARRGR